jgi:hypothetical protein
LIIELGQDVYLSNLLFIKESLCLKVLESLVVNKDQEVRQTNKLCLLFFKSTNDGKEFLIINFVVSLYTLKGLRVKYDKVLLSIEDTLL